MNGQDEFSDRSSVVAEVDRLLAALDRNDISQPEADRLQFLVCHDEQARERYIRSVNLKASLEWDAVSAALVQNGLPADITKNEPHDEPAPTQDQHITANTQSIPLAPLATPANPGLTNATSSAASSIVRWLGRPSSFLMLAFLLTASVAVIIASGMLAQNSTEREKSIAQENRTKPTIPPIAPSVSVSPSVARLTGVYDAVWQDGANKLKDQDLLQVDQRLDLVGGFAEVTFECGAVVTLNAPASIVIKAPNGGKLESGKITARVPGPSAKFWFQTPNNRILDLGTEFGIAVDSSGLEQVRVFDGAVEVGSDQQDVSKTLLRTGEVAVFNPLGERVDSSSLAETLDDSFVRTMPNNYESEYVREILSAKPIGYWSFNSVITSSLVPDVSGKGRFGYMRGSAMIAQGGPVLAIGQAVALDGSTASVAVPAGNTLSLAKDFSMEVLFRTTGNGGVLVSKLPSDGSWLPGSKILFVRGGEVRFSPYTKQGRGAKLISSKVYVNDGQWHHAVLVNKANVAGKKDQTTLYVDGVQRSHRDDWDLGEHDDSKMPVKLGVGSLAYPTDNLRRDTHFPNRTHLAGHLDEVAIYDRCLSVEEVELHYRAYLSAGIARRRMSPSLPLSLSASASSEVSVADEVELE